MLRVIFSHRRRGATAWLHTAKLGALTFAFVTQAPALTPDEALLLVQLLGPVAEGSM